MACVIISADPTVFMYEVHPQNVMKYKLSTSIKTEDAIAELTVIFNKYNPAYPFTYSFADDNYAAKFQQEMLSKFAYALSKFPNHISIFTSSFGIDADIFQLQKIY